MEIILFFIFFAIAGVAQEIFWTGILDSIHNKNPRLTSRSSLWMFPVYGGVFFIILLIQKIAETQPWFIRGILYAIFIITWEYLTGFIIKKLVGVAPWDYSTNDTYDNVGSKKKYQLHGLICLEYLPVWFAEGLLAEAIYLYLKLHFHV